MSESIYSVGDIINEGQYEVLRMLGRGGFGEVYLCRCPENAETYAVKVETEGGFLRREADLYMLLANCSSVPDFFGANVARDPHWLALSEEGENLVTVRQHAEDHRLSPRRLLSVFFHAVKALKEIHAVGLIHCDVRPVNMCIRRSQHKNPILFVDFGHSIRVLQDDGSRVYASTREFSDLSMLSLRVREGKAPHEIDDLQSLAYVILFLRGLWKKSNNKLIKKKAIQLRIRLRDNLSSFLVSPHDQFLLDPIRIILNMTCDELPNYDQIMEAIERCGDFSLHGWSHH